MDDQKTFTCSWDKTLKIMTAICIVYLVGQTVAFAVFAYLLYEKSPVGAIVLGLSGATIFLLPAVWAWAPKGYQVARDGIRILRPIGPKWIPASEVAEVQVGEDGMLRATNTIRTFGVGGLYGYYGYFYNKRLRHFTAYMTRSDSLALIRKTNGKYVLLSPDDADDFVNTVNTLIKPAENVQ
jgi:hypothetical protein